MCEQWEYMLPLLRHRMFFLDDIELLFLNQVSNNCYTSLTVCITRFGSHVILLFQQVRGPVPLGGSICPQTRNAVDGGVQSSRLGIDVWDIPKPIYINNLIKTVQDYPIKPSTSGVEDLLINNTTWRNRRKRKHRLQIETFNEDVKEFNKAPKKVFHHDH
jgi:hypothetical protein